MDDKIKEIIEKTAKDMNVSEFKVTKIVDNIFNFLRNSMNKLEYEEYYIPKLGKFKIIPTRYAKIKEKIALNKASKKEKNNKKDENN